MSGLMEITRQIWQSPPNVATLSLEFWAAGSRQERHEWHWPGKKHRYCACDHGDARTTGCYFLECSVSENEIVYLAKRKNCLWSYGRYGKRYGKSFHRWRQAVAKRLVEIGTGQKMLANLGKILYFWLDRISSYSIGIGDADLDGWDQVLRYSDRWWGASSHLFLSK